MNLLFLGDSLIEFFDWQGRFPGHSVYNCGLAGESVEGLLSRVMRIGDLCPAADRVFIMSGINNLAMGDMEFLDYYRVIIEKLSAAYPKADIFAISLLPAVVDFIEDQSVRKVNGNLIDLVRESGISYMDLYRKFTDEKGRPVKEYLDSDGIHISKPGYAVWSRAVEEVLH